MIPANLPVHVNSKLFHDAIKRANFLLPGRKPVLLHDDDNSVAEFSKNIEIDILDCRKSDLSKVATYNVDESVFIYGCNYSFHGLPFVDEISKLRGKYVVVQLYSGFGTFASEDPNFLRVLDFELNRQKNEEYAKLDVPDLVELCQSLYRTRELRGDFVEVGCFRGSSGSLVLNYMGASGIGRTSWFLDVFDGFNYQAAKESADAHWQGSHKTDGQDLVTARLLRYSRPEIGLNVHVQKCNIITEDLPGAISEIAVASIDVDIYEAVLEALIKVRRRLVPGGIILVEDVNHTPALIGAVLALEHFMQMPDSKGLLWFKLPHAQAMLINVGY